jgi:hypothetical protein
VSALSVVNDWLKLICSRRIAATGSSASSSSLGKGVLVSVESTSFRFDTGVDRRNENRPTPRLRDADRGRSWCASSFFEFMLDGTKLLDDSGLLNERSKTMLNNDNA